MSLVAERLLPSRQHAVTRYRSFRPDRKAPSAFGRYRRRLPLKAGGLIPACSGRGKGAVRIGQTVGIAQLCRAAGVTARASRIGRVRWPEKASHHHGRRLSERWSGSVPGSIASLRGLWGGLQPSGWRALWLEGRVLSPSDTRWRDIAPLQHTLQMPRFTRPK
jgi:hypothetical protein